VSQPAPPSRSQIMILPSQRALFELPDDITWLNCAYMSPQLRSVRAAGEMALGRKAHPWTVRAEDFFTEAEALRALFAGLVGAEAEGVALVPSVSYGMAVAAANLRVEAGQRLLVLAEEFPSNLYPWRELAQRSGGSLFTVSRREDGDWTRAVLEAEPDIYNHNTETVPRLYKKCRPGGRYARVMEIFRTAKRIAPQIPTKTGIILGMGETNEEVVQVMKDLRAVDVDILTLGQYLRPSDGHVALDRYVTPAEFRWFYEIGMALGFRHVESGPLVRSSYHAWEQVQAAGV